MIRWKKRLLRILIPILIIALLFPFSQCLDDGGTVLYTSVLFQVEKKHTLWQENDVNGYLTGTVVRIFGLEVYRDLVFTPSDSIAP